MAARTMSLSRKEREEWTMVALTQVRGVIRRASVGASSRMQNPDGKASSDPAREPDGRCCRSERWRRVAFGS